MRWFVLAFKYLNPDRTGLLLNHHGEIWLMLLRGTNFDVGVFALFGLSKEIRIDRVLEHSAANTLVACSGGVFVWSFLLILEASLSGG